MLAGRAREMGLGALHALSPAEAREKAQQCRNLLCEKIDPITSRDEIHTKRKADASRGKSFKECAEAYIEAHEKSWRNAKHRQQWRNTLISYVYPQMGDIPVQDIKLGHILKVLDQKSKQLDGQTLWTSRPETASRLRGRLEVILDWATTREYRMGENPARWRGHLQNLLPNRSKVRSVRHQPALPYEQIGEFYQLLKQQEGVSALAMRFTILTACRTSEAIGAVWDEVDLEGAVWTIPAERIKAGREHRVPLSEEALSILKSIRDEQREAQKSHKSKSSKPTNLPKYIFESSRAGKPLSNMAMLSVLRRMNRDDITVHGFRSSFRDWCAEQTNFPREVAEAALAHAVGDKVEAAYRRSDLFQKRKLMMDAWARYCLLFAKPYREKVVPITQNKPV